MSGKAYPVTPDGRYFGVRGNRHMARATLYADWFANLASDHSTS